MDIETELVDLVRGFLTITLDENESTQPTWSVESEQYYRALSLLVIKEDDFLVDKIKTFVELIRKKYRNYLEHARRVEGISMTRLGDAVPCDDMCSICLKALRGWRKVVRLKPEDENPEKCGHFLHLQCALGIEADGDGTLKCPICRTVLNSNDGILPTWVDTENWNPQF
jgi:Ring finger domain